MAPASESYTDVLIIGAGPAGLAAAYWMARCGVNARVVDKRATKVFCGYADGLKSGTMELFDSMGFQHRVVNEGVELPEFMFWAHDENGKLNRHKPFRSKSLDGLPYRTFALGQGRIERYILDSIKSSSELVVERGVAAESLEYDTSLDNNHDEYPIRVKLRTLTEEELNAASAYGGSASLTRDNVAPDDVEDLTPKRRNVPGTVEIVKAKYLISCDGGHSWTRKQLGIPFTGSTTEHIWGVIDVVPITNFPDVRRAATVATKHGALIIIPRERQLVRFYVPLIEVNPSSGRFDRSSITLDVMRRKVREMLQPYRFDFKVCDWWTTYQIGQRLAQNFTKGRIYLAGDAVHSHSPKVGLGMNVSIQDGFNIGWKVALVANGVTHPSILDTYELERRRIAEMLVNFDRHWSPLFLKQQGSSVSPDSPRKYDAMKEVLDSNEAFAECIVSLYSDSPLVHKNGQGVAKNLSAGERLIAAKVRNQADGRPEWTTRILQSDGRFRILLLAGDIRQAEQKRRVLAFGEYLASHNSVLRRYTSNPGRLHATIDTITIHSAPVEDVELSDLPEALRPFDEDSGWDYSKVWSDGECYWEWQCNGKTYERWGVDRLRGAVVVLRPDQYAGWIGELEDVEGLSKYFEGILRSPRQRAVL
ncbi:putative phenol 2-monooxygenase [Aspergillus alliaceus]|uniref:putative phenol 2-monooxygenase n=1 Tax=Petromyces alliaceus TaxID=209559 RepID=UPI0012A70793|nr:FAD binding domain-containing protein [Aspergillus alliaceus]KAB8237359.1 FAD binding domain-containing protein [Aspergillus alliaceus]